MYEEMVDKGRFSWRDPGLYDDKYIENLGLIDLVGMYKFAISGLNSDGFAISGLNSDGEVVGESARKLKGKIVTMFKDKDLMKGKIKEYLENICKGYLGLSKSYTPGFIYDCLTVCKECEFDSSLIYKLAKLDDLCRTIDGQFSSVLKALARIAADTTDGHDFELEDFFRMPV